jgi:hypothetical protein
VLEAVLVERGWGQKKGLVGRGGVEAASVKIIGLGERGVCRVVSWWGVVIVDVTNLSSLACP